MPGCWGLLPCYQETKFFLGKASDILSSRTFFTGHCCLNPNGQRIEHIELWSSGSMARSCPVPGMLRRMHSSWSGTSFHCRAGVRGNEEGPRWYLVVHLCIWLRFLQCSCAAMDWSTRSSHASHVRASSSGLWPRSLFVCLCPSQPIFVGSFAP